MKLLQDLLALSTKVTVSEEASVIAEATAANKEKDLDELLDKYMEQEKMYHFDGMRGVRNFEQIIKVIGYRDVDYFLEDNPGCINAMIDWIKDMKNTEWAEALTQELHGDVESEEGEE